MLSENNMASLGGEEINSIKNQSVDEVTVTAATAAAASEKNEEFPIRKQISTTTIHWFAQVGSDLLTGQEEGGDLIDPQERLRLIKDRQNEERQRKLEELKAQAIAAQKYREQKEEERRRRIDEMRSKEFDRKQQVEERKKAIMDAERDRRDYILRKNLERDSRIETKQRSQRSQIAFAFGSSTPRLLDPVDVGSMSPSSLWGHRRSTSITNVAYSGAPLSRRSSERELSDTPKKRATSAGGLDRNEVNQHRMSTSMYEVFNWGHLNDERPKRYSLAIAGSHIDIDEPSKQQQQQSNRNYHNNNNHHHNNNNNNHHHQQQKHHNNNNNHNNTRPSCNDQMDDTTDSAHLSYRSVARRKTDLMPTIPSPREHSFGSRSSLYCHTPRTPGRTVSMTRLDLLAQPIRRNGEHIRAVIERQKQQEQQQQHQQHQQQNDSMSNSQTLSHSSPNHIKSMSRSLTHLAGSTNASNKNKSLYHHRQQLNHHHHQNSRPLSKTSSSSKSMTQLVADKLTRKNSNTTVKQSKQQKIHSSDSVSIAGSRSGEVTPGASRPGSALSTSTSVSGVLYRRTGPSSARKPRPASIAGTGMSIDSMNDAHKQRKDKPPIPRVASAMRKSFTHSSSTTTTTATGLNSNNSVTSSTVTTATTTPKDTPKRTPSTPSVDKHRPPPSSSSMSSSMSASSSKRSTNTPRTPAASSVQSLQQHPQTPGAAAISSTPIKISKSSKVIPTSTPQPPIIQQQQQQPQQLPIEQQSQKSVQIKSEEPIVSSEIVDSVIVNDSESLIDNSIDAIAAVVDDDAAVVVDHKDIHIVASEAVNEIVSTAESMVTNGTIDRNGVDIITAEQLVNISVPLNDTPAATVTSSNIEVFADEDVNTNDNSVVRQLNESQQQQQMQNQQQQQQHHHHLDTSTNDTSDVMTASMIKRVSTEEQAKAALAERRRLAREEAERQAELERQRLEALELAEEKRLAEEEENQRRLEEETLRLVEEQRKAEELRLLQAIEEASQREEDERKRKEDEEKQRIEREEQEKKAREEAEKQKVEIAERLKKEEKEREERRKRVEAIMARTRAKGTPGNTPNKADDKETTEKSNETVSSNSNNEHELQQTPAAVVAVEETVTDKSKSELEAGNQQQLQQPQQTPTINDYERSVTDKENALINSFSNLIVNNHQEISNNINLKTNGKSLDFDLVNEEDHQQSQQQTQLIHNDSGISNGNGHSNHSLDNLVDTTNIIMTNHGEIDNKLQQQQPLPPPQQQQQQHQQHPLSGQLIDFNLDTTTTSNTTTTAQFHSDVVNFNNNNNNNNSLITSTTAATTLVTTSDSHENKEISLL